MLRGTRSTLRKTRHAMANGESELGRRFRNLKKIVNSPKDVNLPLEGPALRKKQQAETQRQAAEKQAVQHLKDLTSKRGLQVGGKRYGSK